MKRQSQRLVERKFTDSDGLPAVVLVPEGETDLSTGIPQGLNLSTLYQDMPKDFQRRLYEALHAQGLIKPKDYFKPNASQLFKAAMLTVIRHDFLSAQRIAKEELK